MSERNGGSSGPGLLSIPPEIRDTIYGHLLPDIQEFLSYSTKVYWSRPGIDKRGLNQQFCPPAIARVHPKIRAEVLARMYTNLRLHIRSTSETTSFTKWLGRCNIDIINSIRSIVIVAQIQSRIFPLGELSIKLSSDPKAKIYWRKTTSNVPSRWTAPYGAMMDAARTAVLRTMEACMPKHPHYDRRVFTQHAFMTLKAELWYQLGFKGQRESVPKPGAKKTPEAKKSAALRRRRRRQRQLHWGH